MTSQPQTKEWIRIDTNQNGKSEDQFVYTDLKDLDDTKPRLLTDKEIKGILSNINPAFSLDKEVSRVATVNLHNEIRRQLIRVEIVPTKEALNQLTERINLKYKAARSAMGIPVGIIAGEAVGAAITQIALDTFHRSGEDSELGIDTIKSFLNAVQKPKNEISSIYFNIRVTPRDVYDMNVPLVEISCHDLLLSHDIYPVDLEDKEGHNGNLRFEEWDDLWPIMTGIDLPQSKTVMRLRFDTSLMYKHGISMKRIMDNIEGMEGCSLYYAVPSSIVDGVIDIFPKEDAVKEKLSSTYDIDNLSEVFLVSTIIESMKNTRIKGIPGIKGIFPITKPLSMAFGDSKRSVNIEYAYIKSRLKSWNSSYARIFKEDIPVKYQDMARKVHTVPVKQDFLLVHGVSTDMLQKSIVQSGCIPVGCLYSPVKEGKKGDITTLYIYVPTGENFKDYYNRWSESNKDNHSMITSITYAETIGTNIEKLSFFPWIDKKRTISNNLHDMTKIYGSQVAKRILDAYISDMMYTSGVSIDHRHISVIVDFMFRLGVPLPLAYSGIAKQRSSFMLKATIEKAMASISQAAAHDDEDDAYSMSTAITVGNPVSVGPNSYRIFPTENSLKIMKENKRKRLDKLQKNLERRNNNSTYTTKDGVYEIIEEKETSTEREETSVEEVKQEEIIEETATEDRNDDNDEAFNEFIGINVGDIGSDDNNETETDISIEISEGNVSDAEIKDQSEVNHISFTESNMQISDEEANYEYNDDDMLNYDPNDHQF